MKSLYKKQEKNIIRRINERNKEMALGYKHQKIEERNLYNYLKNGFPTNRSVLFFDDALENIEYANNHSRRIIPVYLPFDEIFMFKKFDTQQTFDNIKTLYRNNNYVNNMSNESLVKSNGITNKYTTVDDEELPTIEQRLYDWILQTSNHKQRYAFFDWDYTLNVYGGFKLIDKSTKTMDDTLTVLLGGHERLENIRHIMHFLTAHHIKIYILTANPQAYYNKEMFVLLLQRLISKEFTSQQLIYADIYNTPKYKLIHEVISSNKRYTSKRQRNLKNTTKKHIK